VLPTDNLELGAFASLTDGKYKTFYPTELERQEWRL
jgi:hypothetical protein